MILSNRIAIAVALTSGVCGVGALIVACGSSSPSGSNGGPGTTTGQDGSSTTTTNDDGGGSNSTVNNSTPGSCASATIPILFSPMYSAFIPGSTAQQFQVPAVTNDGNAASWSSSDPTSVQLAPDSTTGGVMITMTAVPASGSITIFAAEGSTCGSSTLNVTSNLETDWSTGNSRYNDGVAIHIGKPDGGGFHIPDGGFDAAAFEGGHGGGGPSEDAGSFFEEDGGTACVNCHGPVQIGNSGFSNVAHTPEQTGGFSDSQLIDIIVNGAVPDGGYFDPAVLNSTCTDAGTTLLPGWVDGTGQSCAVHAYKEWQTIHRWVDITGDEQAGIVCYLRSLTPVPQGGSSDFGGGGGGGFGDGGAHHHHDAGSGPPPGTDSGSPDDAGDQ